MICVFIIHLLGVRMRIFASRQCADYARTSYAGASEARVARVTFAVGEASCLVFVVSKPRWPRCAVVQERRRPRSESSVSECVILCDAHMAYMYLGPACGI